MIHFRHIILVLLIGLLTCVAGFIVIPMKPTCRHPPLTSSSSLDETPRKKSCADEKITAAATSDVTSVVANKTKRKLYSFTEARKIARGHGFSTIQEFLDYDCPGAYQLPKNPDQVWAAEWKGWNNFLGILWDFETARQVAREQLPSSIDSKEVYMEAFQQKLFSEDDDVSLLPYRPDLYYKKQWQGWDDFLGN